MSYNLQIAPAAKKTLDRPEPMIRRRVTRAIIALADNPRPHGYIKMEGLPVQYRIRVADYRIVYQIEDDRLVVTVVQIPPRDKVYKKR